MKRIISAVLAVLICVLTLCGCEKTPTGQESGSGSSFAESNEASVSGEAESSKSEDSEQEENFDYTGWQEFSYEMNALACKIYSSSDENRKGFPVRLLHIRQLLLLSFRQISRFFMMFTEASSIPEQSLIFILLISILSIMKKLNLPLKSW